MDEIAYKGREESACSMDDVIDDLVRAARSCERSARQFDSTEIDNIRKDLEAVFDQVVCLVKERASTKNVKIRLQETLEATQGSLVQVGCLTEYAEILRELF